MAPNADSSEESSCVSRCGEGSSGGSSNFRARLRAFRNRILGFEDKLIHVIVPFRVQGHHKIKNDGEMLLKWMMQRKIS